MLAPLFSRILRLVSLAICLIAVGWFVGFAVEQSKKGSAHQQAELNESAPPSLRTPVSGASSTSAKHGGVRKAIDSAFSTFSSPFSGLTSGMSGAWPSHIVNTLLVLLIYGFGLGFVARLLRFSS